MKSYEEPVVKAGCKYTFEIPGVGSCCNAYSESKHPRGYHWAHYPNCCNKECPLVHPELLEGAILEEK